MLSVEEDDSDSDSSIADEEIQPPAKLGDSDVTEDETQPEEETLQVQTGRSEDDPEQPLLSSVASSPQAPAKSSSVISPIQDRLETDGHLEQSNRQERGLLDHNSGNDFLSNDAGQQNDPFSSPRIRKRMIEADRSCFSPRLTP
jgi:hypothetical protein